MSTCGTDASAHCRRCLPSPMGPRGGQAAAGPALLLSSRLALLSPGWIDSSQTGEGISPARQSEGLCLGTPGIALGCLCSLHEKTRRVHSPSGMCLGASGWGRRQAPCGEASCLSAFCLSQASDNWLPKEGGEVPGVPGRTWCQVGRCQHWGRTGSPPGAPPLPLGSESVSGCLWGQHALHRGPGTPSACGSSPWLRSHLF